MKLLTEGKPSSEATAVAIAALEVRLRERFPNDLLYLFVFRNGSQRMFQMEVVVVVGGGGGGMERRGSK